MKRVRAGWMLIIFAVLTGCSLSGPEGTNTPPNPAPSKLSVFPTASLTPFQPLPPTAPPPTPTPADNLTLWVDPGFPGEVTLPEGVRRVSAPESADLRLEIGGDHPITKWIFVLAAPFPEITDGVTLAELLAAWRGKGRPVMVEEATARVLNHLWGEPAPGAVDIVPGGGLLPRAWDAREVWVILPFEKLEPRWKVISLEEKSPIHKDFDPETFPLTIPFSLAGDPQAVQMITSQYGPGSSHPIVPVSNRDPEHMTIVALTGVTALVRATAWTMEQQGITYPAQEVGPWLREADITHISNEVPFARDCPYPNPVQSGVVFCSDPRYLELLSDVGTDVVELTGDHFHDWGTKAMLLTLAIYDNEGWPYYGGGANLEAGKQAVLLEHNGNRFAFIGCNAKGWPFAQAGPDSPGSVPCDFDWMHAEIKRLTGEGYNVITTFQHFEYYSYRVPASMQADFKGMAEAGAVIVSGSQAHQPHGFDFFEGSFIHYGLGNLFFDQYNISPATRQGFIDRHIFYEGRHLSTELLTLEFVDYARPRLMTPAERADLLQAVFAASGW